MVCTGIGAAAYGLLAAVTFWEWGLALGHGQVSLLITMAVCAAGLLLARFGRPWEGAVLGVAAVWFKTHFSLLTTTIFPDPALFGTAALVVGAALALRPRQSVVVAASSLVVSSTLIVLSAPVRASGVTPTVTYWLIAHAISTMAIWALVILGHRILRQTAAEVSEKERDLRETIDRAPDGILIVDGAQVVQVMNPAAESVLGLTTGECLGCDVAEVLRRADTAVQPTSSVDLHTSGEHARHWTITRRGGQRAEIEITWRVMQAGRRQFLLRDVSERMRAEENRRDMELQLAHAQRLEAVGQLAGGIAHDFNNILTIVGASAEVLRLELGQHREVPLLDDILAAQERGAALTRQLLAFARREVVQQRVFDLGEQVGLLQRLLQRVGGEQLRLSCDVQPACTILADVGQVEQALVNLVSNARDAMPQGGRCVVAVRRVTDDSGDPWVRLSVTDEGAGMDAATRSRAFEPFFTTKPRGRGTGLGLSAVHGMVLQSGGHADIVSERGKGTSVILDFPVAEAVAQSPTAADPALQPSVGGTVLVAEDDDGTRGAVARILSQRGYEVLQASDGDEAMRLVSARTTRIDLLLTDVMMPGATGPQLAEQLRTRQPALPVIFMSGYPEDALAAVPGLVLESDFLAKPFTSVALSNRVSAKLRAAATTGAE